MKVTGLGIRYKVDFVVCMEGGAGADGQKPAFTRMLIMKFKNRIDNAARIFYNQIGHWIQWIPHLSNTGGINV